MNSKLKRIMTEHPRPNTGHRPAERQGLERVLARLAGAKAAANANAAAAQARDDAGEEAVELGWDASWAPLVGLLEGDAPHEHSMGVGLLLRPWAPGREFLSRSYAGVLQCVAVQVVCTTVIVGLYPIVTS